VDDTTGGDDTARDEGRTLVPVLLVVIAVLALLAVGVAAGWGLAGTDGPTCTTTTADGVTTETCQPLWWGMARKDVVAEARQYLALVFAAAAAVYALYSFIEDRRAAFRSDAEFRGKQVTFQQEQLDREDKLRQERVAGANLSTAVHWVRKDAGLARVEYTIEPTDRRVEIVRGRAAPTRLLVVAQWVDSNQDLRGTLVHAGELQLPRRINKGEERRGLVPLRLPPKVDEREVVGYVVIARVEGWDHVRLVDAEYLTPQGTPTEKMKDLAAGSDDRLDASAQFVADDYAYLATHDEGADVGVAAAGTMTAPSGTTPGSTPSGTTS
jgi:hypothetical protein